MTRSKQMQKSDDKPVADRRSFLKLAGAGVVTGGAALADGKPAEAAEAKPARPLYRETEHVKRYYELARS
jgi:hypothetical protein